MLISSKRSFLAAFALLLVAVFPATSQERAPSPSPSPSPAAEDQVRVFTEEVRLPVIAVDQFGHYDPTVEPEDVLVLEDGVAQQVRSVRHIPANVVLVLDTGGELSGLGGQSKSTSLTRDVAIELLNRMRPGTWVEVMQFNDKVETVHDWTTDTKAVALALKTKVSAGKISRFGDAMAAAALDLSERPEGSRHLVIITDGVDSGSRIDRTEAVKRLMAARATIHILSYTQYVLQKKEGRAANVSGGQMPTTSDPITTTDPTQPPGTTRSPSYGVGIRFDPAMRRQRKAYEASVKKSQQILSNLALETGGQILLPKTRAEMMSQVDEISREIGAEYVLTYRPRRPLAEAREGEYRRVEVASRRVGLNLRSRRGYVVPKPERNK